MSYKMFSDTFLEPYKTREVKFGPLGYVTYKRTYARWIESENRTEEWWETCRRVLEGNYALEINHLVDTPGSRLDLLKLTKEAEQAYDDMFNLRWLPPGRGLWMSGTATGKENGGSLTNCYYVDTAPKGNKVSYPFTFAMDMLMLGAGVGFGVSRSSVDLIPAVRNPVHLRIVCAEDHRDYQFLKADKIPYGESHQYITIEDTRNGWVYGLKKVIDASFLSKRGNPKTVVIDVSKVRPSGERIKGFGGTASGPFALVECLRGINHLLNARVAGRLSPVDVTDIMTMIGRCVVSGNVRRSAMIALGDSDDQQFIEMKNPKEGDEEHNERIRNNRWASNNSVYISDHTDFSALAESIWVKGEPGFINLPLIQSYGRLIGGKSDVEKATGTNPCGEISLESYEPCNLAEIFPSNCADFAEVKRVALTAYRYAKRVTLSHYPWEESQEVVSRNRRVGVSISGIRDWVLQLQLQIQSGEALGMDELLSNNLVRLYNCIRAEDKRFSAHLNIPKSIKLTTVKPSGTISLLAGVSPGIHYPYAPYYIRRIQFQQEDPMVPYLKELGFRVTKAVQTPRAWVVQFPIKEATADMEGFKSAGEVSAEEQLKFQELIQCYWSDNQVSCTVSLIESDKDKLPDLLRTYGKRLKSTSFLPYTPAIKDHYPDLPYEPITQVEYESMLAEIKEWPSKLLLDTKNNQIDNDECKGGACPVR